MLFFLFFFCFFALCLQQCCSRTMLSWALVLLSVATAVNSQEALLNSTARLLQSQYTTCASCSTPASGVVGQPSIVWAAPHLTAPTPTASLARHPHAPLRAPHPALPAAPPLTVPRARARGGTGVAAQTRGVCPPPMPALAPAALSRPTLHPSAPLLAPHPAQSLPHHRCSHPPAV